MKRFATFLRSLGVYLALCVATLLMLRMVVDYTAFRDDVDFLQFKQSFVSYWWWKTAFYIHVFSATAALMAGFTQFSGYILRHHRACHRLIGRIYAYDMKEAWAGDGAHMCYSQTGSLPHCSRSGRQVG